MSTTAIPPVPSSPQARHHTTSTHWRWGLAALAVAGAASVAVVAINRDDTSTLDPPAVVENGTNVGFGSATAAEHRLEVSARDPVAGSATAAEHRLDVSTAPDASSATAAEHRLDSSRAPVSAVEGSGNAAAMTPVQARLQLLTGLSPYPV